MKTHAIDLFIPYFLVFIQLPLLFFLCKMAEWVLQCTLCLFKFEFLSNDGSRKDTRGCCGQV